jgi:hypothetical protein
MSRPTARYAMPLYPGRAPCTRARTPPHQTTGRRFPPIALLFPRRNSARRGRGHPKRAWAWAQRKASVRGARRKKGACVVRAAARCPIWPAGRFSRSVVFAPSPLGWAWGLRRPTRLPLWRRKGVSGNTRSSLPRRLSPAPPRSVPAVLLPFFFFPGCFACWPARKREASRPDASQNTEVALSTRLVYQEREVSKMNEAKREQAERLGMGFGAGRSSNVHSHSSKSTMQVCVSVGCPRFQFNCRRLTPATPPGD